MLVHCSGGRNNNLTVMYALMFPVIHIDAGNRNVSVCVCVGTSAPSLQLLIGTKGKRLLLLHILETHSLRSESTSWTSCQLESFLLGLQEDERHRHTERERGGGLERAVLTVPLLLTPDVLLLT